MARAIKFKNNDYLDSTGIVHNKVLLSTIIDSKTIYDSGSNGNGSYIRFTDGTMIAYGTKTYSNVVSTTDYWSFTNRTPEDMFCTFPIAFTVAPSVSMNFTSSVSGCIGLYQTGASTTTRTGNYGVTVAKGSTANRNIILDYIAIGKWK